MIQEAAQCWRNMSVRLPEGATLQDINDNQEIWAVVQRNALTALRRLDHVEIFAWDESFVVQAIVTAASGTGVSLAIVKKIDLPPRTLNLAARRRLSRRVGRLGIRPHSED